MNISLIFTKERDDRKCGLPRDISCKKVRVTGASDNHANGEYTLIEPPYVWKNGNNLIEHKQREWKKGKFRIALSTAYRFSSMFQIKKDH